MTIQSSIKVMIVDDHPLVRVGLATIINQQSDMAIVADTDSGHRALDLVRRDRPNVVLMDMRLHGDSGARATSAIMGEFPDARVLMISNYEDDEEIRQALAAGAKGYLFKSIVEDELVGAIHEIHAGRSYMPPSVAGRLQEHASSGRLTRREEEILELVSKV